MPLQFVRSVQRRLRDVKARVRGTADEPSAPEGTLDSTTSDETGPLDFEDNCGGPAAGFDLVFVHGLRGSRLKTWSRNGVFWPRDLLKHDMKNARVITWGYDASVANAFTYASNESLFGHASTLLGDLARLRRDITRPIIFVCHSLGGLVVKEALITSASYKAHERHPQHGKIYSNTIGVIFMGTPHRGSSKASHGDILVNIARLSLRQPNNQLLQNLRPDSHILEKQRNDFTTVSNDMAIVCIREELPTIGGMIVPEESASYDGFNVVRDAIHANHMEMAKFDSKVEGYKRTIGHIQDILDAKRPKAESKAKQDKETIEARKHEILNALKVPITSSREEEIVKAHAGTCSWVWKTHPVSDTTQAESSDLQVWLRNTEPFIWISGKAGCGKSTLMKYIYRDPQTKTELEHSAWADGKKMILVGHFFYERGNNDQKSREGMLKSILFQVLKNRHGLIPMIFSQGDFFDDLLRKPNEFFTWETLSCAFITALNYLRDSRICLFLDGLDEYRMAGRERQYTEEELDLIYDAENEDDAWGESKWITEGHNEVAQFLRQFETFDNVKVCISSRELVVFEHKFRDFPRIVVHTHTAGAIAKYCTDRLTSDAPDLVDLLTFVSMITKKSLGVFLWVRIVIDLILDGYVKGNYTQEIWDDIEKLPQRLGGKDGLYMHMMRIVEPRYLSESKRLFQLVQEASDKYYGIGHLDIMSLFLAEQGHLCDDSTLSLRVSSDEYEPKTWDEWEGRWKHLQKRLKSRCGGLLEGAEEVQFMHQTAKQFISRKYLWPEVFRGAPGFAAEADIDLALASGLIRRLKCCSEVVVTHANAPTGTGSIGGSLRGPGVTTDPCTIHPLDCSILHHIILLAAFFESRKSSTNDLNDIIRLLDELDNIGDWLTRDWRNLTDAEDLVWPEVYFRCGARLRTFLDFMTLMRVRYYVEAKLEERDFSRDNLSHLLFIATSNPTIDSRGKGGSTTFSRDRKMIEALLQKGADPNSQNVELDSSTTTETASTAWTMFLQRLYLPSPSFDITNNEMTDITKLFLKYGADPAVRWYRQAEEPYSRNTKAQTGCEFASPETVIREYAKKRRLRDGQLDEILEILRRRLLDAGETGHIDGPGVDISDGSRS
ncbi:hypothetical protein F4680DRAFT_416200 [Xylaria scruposa]|nr:hypothetical protein F4680DRAFT_416200 [Xylaria scruposa]